MIWLESCQLVRQMNYRVESRSMVLLVLVWIVGVDSVGHVSRDQERVPV